MRVGTEKWEWEVTSPSISLVIQIFTYWSSLLPVMKNWELSVTARVFTAFLCSKRVVSKRPYGLHLLALLVEGSYIE